MTTDKAPEKIWDYCPECGSENYHGGYYTRTLRLCTDCGQDWHTDIDYTEVVGKNLRPLRADARPTAQVKVKPLEWCNSVDGRGQIAVTEVGQYAVFDEGSPRWAFSKRGGYTYHPTKDIDEAKATAQADYEKRILSSLDTQTGLREAARVLRELRETLETIEYCAKNCIKSPGQKSNFELAQVGKFKVDTALRALAEEGDR
ncbi:hypothetical protein Q5Y75_05850 [Ruegeria sp. 2205SS24-7]|uniref:hypothetical protein n=1 Tax=Ruegeria discodermiae TaxID=3064389 RepID=UPI002741C27A|nr:hypothetical protein [Ruegeria sp. 2205SS24-7]MDP5216735.1 hypothetical protein [Ruegeria sp. 2205SS24-7]